MAIVTLSATKGLDLRLRVNPVKNLILTQPLGNGKEIRDQR